MVVFFSIRSKFGLNTILLQIPDPFNLVRASLLRPASYTLTLFCNAQMFQIPSMTIMSIAATRMYRSLADFASESTEVSDIQPFPPVSPRSRWLLSFSFLDTPQTVPRTKSTAHVSIPSPQRELSLNTV
jgi:hypothetical protein